MSAAPNHHPTFLRAIPRFIVHNMEQALAFYNQLGFATVYQDEGFAMVERDGIALHMNCFPEEESPKGHSVCYIDITNSEALYQEYLPTNAVQSPLKVTWYGAKEFFICDPFRNLIIFGENL